MKIFAIGNSKHILATWFWDERCDLIKMHTKFPQLIYNERYVFATHVIDGKKLWILFFNVVGFLLLSDKNKALKFKKVVVIFSVLQLHLTCICNTMERAVFRYTPSEGRQGTEYQTSSTPFWTLCPAPFTQWWLGCRLTIMWGRYD